MKKILRQYLHSIGLKTCASDADAVRYMESLTGPEAEFAAKLAEGGGKAFIDEDGDGLCDVCGMPEEECTCEDQDQDQDTGDDASDDASESMEGLSVGEAMRRFGVDRVAATRKPLRISVGDDLNRGSLTDAVADAICLRSNPKCKFYDAEGNERKAHPRAEQFRRLPLYRLAQNFLAANGLPVNTMTEREIRRAAWDLRGLDGRPLTPMGAHSTSDFPSVLGMAMNRSLQREYIEYAPQWPKYCRKATAKDFREIHRTNADPFPNLAVVEEGGEYTYGSFGDRREVYRVVKYGKKFSLTWEAIVNDDLDAFSRIPRNLMSAARRLEDSLPIAVLTTNAAMGDGIPLFDAAHGNIATSTADKGVPTVARLNAMRLAMRLQSVGDAILNIEPAALIVPAALEGISEQILTSENDPSASVPNVKNIWQGKLELVVSPLLDATSPTAWYAAADPGQYDGIEVCFLEGYEAPTLEQVETMSPDIREFSIRHVCAAKATSWLSLYANPGE